MGINFQNVVFKYSKKASKNILNNISLNINKNDDALVVYKDDDGEESLSFRSLLLLPRLGVIKYFNIKDLLLEN